MNCHTRSKPTAKMTKPKVRVNSFFKNRSCSVDTISKIFIMIEMVLGLNRLALFGNVKRIIIKIGHAYCAIFLLALFFFPLSAMSDLLVSLSIHNSLYGLTIVLSFILRKRLRKYFTQLSLFDTEVECEIKISRVSMRNLVQCIFSVLCCLSTLLVDQILFVFNWSDLTYLPISLLRTVQFYFSAHLISALVIRMQLVNYLFQNSLPNGETIRPLDKAVRFKSPKPVQLTTLIHYFNRIIKAYDTLNQAIKWQLLFTIIEVFLIAIIGLYNITWRLLRKKFDINDTFLLVNILTVNFIPMLSLCMIGDTLHKEVLWLRETVACRLYEGRFERQHRRSAQALLTLTEARGLSFSLFHMFVIDISLPFKIIKLLITNIIIMLQFNKVKSNSKQTLFD